MQHEDLIIYELHIGVFTDEGTFAAATQRLGELADLGITAIELMPVADAAGKWNWGYDGVCLLAPPIATTERQMTCAVLSTRRTGKAWR